jgi:hypothetical protein
MNRKITSTLILGITSVFGAAAWSQGVSEKPAATKSGRMTPARSPS